jgi:hypothetical protein
MADDAKKPKPSQAAAGDLQVLSLAEAQLAVLGKTFDAEGLENLRTVVAGYSDPGSEGAGEVVASLAALLDQLFAGRRFDREAIAVHIRAWRLMVTAELEATGRAAVLNGLSAVRGLYAEAKAA